MAKKPADRVEAPAPVLDYRTQRREIPRYGFKYVAAGTFGFFAIFLGILFGGGAITSCDRAADEQTTRDRINGEERALRLAGCSGLLLAAGAWYFRVGVRGNPAARLD